MLEMPNSCSLSSFRATLPELVPHMSDYDKMSDTKGVMSRPGSHRTLEDISEAAEISPRLRHDRELWLKHTGFYDLERREQQLAMFYLKEVEDQRRDQWEELKIEPSPHDCTSTDCDDDEEASPPEATLSTAGPIEPVSLSSRSHEDVPEEDRETVLQPWQLQKGPASGGSIDERQAKPRCRYFLMRSKCMHNVTMSQREVR